MSTMPEQQCRALAESLTPEALILSLKSNEHDFVERKPRNQKGDWLQTAVAFANSAPVGWPAVLFVGVDDDGNPQYQPDQLEALTQSVSSVLEQAYPPIYRYIVPLNLPEGRSCLAVVIPGSSARPHFAGQAYVRLGDATKVASGPLLTELIAQRNSKIYTILQWVGKEITWVDRVAYTLGAGYREMFPQDPHYVLLCNPHFATFRRGSGVANEAVYSCPLIEIELSFDDVRQRLRINRYNDR
jgi:hypothetical protein